MEPDLTMAEEHPELDPPILPMALKAIAKGALSRDGCVQITPHACRNMRQPDRDFSFADVMHVIDCGDYSAHPPERRDGYDCWFYTVVGRDLEGLKLKLVITVSEDGNVLHVITGQRFYRGKRV